MYSELRLHAAILSWWVFDVILSLIQPLKSNWSVLNVNNGGPWNPGLALKENNFMIKFEAQDFASEMSNKHAFKIWRKKRSEFFDHSSTLRKSQRIKAEIYVLTVGLIEGKQENMNPSSKLPLLLRREYQFLCPVTIDWWLNEWMTEKRKMKQKQTDSENGRLTN